MRVYLSGGMTNHEDFNYPKFHERAAAWRRAGFDVCNPAEHFGGAIDIPGGWGTYLRYDLAVLTTCQAIVVLPGWEQSRGACVEVAVARLLGMPVFDAETFRPLDPQPSGFITLVDCGRVAV